MMILSQDQIEDDYVSELTIYPSLYAYSAYCARYDETPLDRLVRQYYCSTPLQVALEA
jgi:hypothetical protein